MHAIRLRVFTALLPDPVACQWLQRQLPTAWPDDLRPVPRANWHLTLHFHGGLSPAQVEALIHRLDRLDCPAVPPLRTHAWLDLPQDRPSARVLSLSDDHESLEGLRAALPAAGQAAAERRPFLPHITVGRYRRGRRAPAWPAPPPADIRLPRLALLESRSTTAGVVYRPLWQRPLSVSA